MRLKARLLALAGAPALSLALASALAAAPAYAVWSDDHAPASIDPADYGLKADRLAALDAALAARVEAGARPGYALIVAVGDEIVHVSETGLVDIEAGRAMTVDSPIRIASMTKPLTTFAVMMLVEAGEVALDDPVSDYIPAFADVQVAVSPMAGPDGEIETRAPARPITLRDLMTHTAGLGYIFESETDLGRLYLANSLYEGEGDLEARMEQLAALPLYADPGERWIYSYAQDVLGRVVEVASGQSFQSFMDERIFTPLEMHDTGFFFEDVAFDESEMTPLYVHDENGEMVRSGQANPNWASGGGGLVSTASDYIRFAMLLANGGEAHGVRLISEEGLAEMLSPQLTREQLGAGWEGANFGYGLAVVVPPAEGETPQGYPGDASWGGMFDTDFVVMPSRNLSAVAMTQIGAGPHRPGPRTSAVFRPLLYAATAGE